MKKMITRFTLFAFIIWIMTTNILAEDSKNYDIFEKNAVISFPWYKTQVQYTKSNTLQWTFIGEDGSVKSWVEDLSYKALAKDMHFLNWIEETGFTVSQTINTTTGKVDEFISWSGTGKTARGERESNFIEWQFLFSNKDFITLPSLQTTSAMKTEARKNFVKDFYQEFFWDKNVEAAKKYISNKKYIQHNPAVADGLEPFMTAATSWFEWAWKSKVDVKLMGSEWNFVWMLVKDYDAEWKELSVIDLFRLEWDKIVEHWDVIQPVPETSANNNTMFPLTQDVYKTTSPEIELQNKKTVVTAYQSLFWNHNLKALDKYWSDDYVQHNPLAVDGKEWLRQFLENSWTLQQPKSKLDIKRVIADGNLVFVHLKSNFWQGDVSVMDIFRVEEGKIVEHWDTIQAIPEESANDHPMF